MKSYQVYLFDLDGTITNTGPTWIGIFHDVLASFGLTGFDDKTIAQHTHDWREMLKLGITEDELPEFTRRTYKLANERLPLAPLYGGVKEIFTVLRNEGKRLGIFSTMDRPILEPVIKRYNFDKLFDVIVAGTDVEHRKPHPLGIQHALKKLSVGTDGVVYIGDKDTDILCAHNAGVDSILFFPEDHKLMYDEAALLASDPTHIIRKWSELSTKHIANN